MVVGIFLLLFSSFFSILYLLGTKSGLKILRQYISKFELKIKNNPFLLVLIYLVYIVLIGLISGGSYQYLITPLVAPLTIIIGIFVWQWQEDVKNKTAKNEQYKKKYNEKAEIIFGIYNRYEKSIQNIYSLFNDLDVVLQPRIARVGSKSTEISRVILEMESELNLIKKAQLDLYNEAVLFYHLISNNFESKDLYASEIDVYSKSYNLLNSLYLYATIHNKISKILLNYKHSERDQIIREESLIEDFYSLKQYFRSFNFGYSSVSKEVIYDAPRKIFIELTKAI